MKLTPCELLRHLVCHIRITDNLHHKGKISVSQTMMVSRTTTQNYIAFTIKKNGSSALKGGTPEGSEVDLVFSF